MENETRVCRTCGFISQKCRESARRPRVSAKDEALSRSSVSKCRCTPGSNETHSSSSHVRGKISMRRATRTKQNAGAEHQDDARAPPFSPALPLPFRLSNQSATNEQHELACKTTRRGVPARRVVIPHLTESKSMNRSTLDPCTRGPSHFGRGIPPRGSNSTADSRRETRTGGERGKERVGEG